LGIDDYVEWSRRVGAPASTRDAPAEHLAYLGLGLAGEAGEVSDVVRRALRDGTPLDAARLALLDESRRKIEARLAARRE